MQGTLGTQRADVDPRAAALAWQADGAEWIHLVDLDAAFGQGSNAPLLAAVIGELDVSVQLSGGIRDDASLDRALSTGCERIVLSTAALDDQAWCARAIGNHGNRIAVGLDVRIVERAAGPAQHRLVARGATADVGDLWTMLEWLNTVGCARYVVTDVSRDGMLSGPNLDLCRAVTSVAAAPVIASGGISSIHDLIVLATAATGANVEGAIIGKALYAGHFTLAHALAAVTEAG